MLDNGFAIRRVVMSSRCCGWLLAGGHNNRSNDKSRKITQIILEAHEHARGESDMKEMYDKRFYEEVFLKSLVTRSMDFSREQIEILRSEALHGCVRSLSYKILRRLWRNRRGGTRKLGQMYGVRWKG